MTYTVSIYSSGSPVRNISISASDKKSAALLGLTQGGNGITRLSVVSNADPEDEELWSGARLSILRALL